MDYLTVYKKDNDYYYQTVTYCVHDIGYLNSYGRELISIQIMYKGRYYDLESHEKIYDGLAHRDLKYKKRYQLFKKILYIFS